MLCSYGRFSILECLRGQQCCVQTPIGAHPSSLFCIPSVCPETAVERGPERRRTSSRPLQRALRPQRVVEWPAWSTVTEHKQHGSTQPPFLSSIRALRILVSYSLSSSGRMRSV